MNKKCLILSLLFSILCLFLFTSCTVRDYNTTLTPDDPAYWGADGEHSYAELMAMSFKIDENGKYYRERMSPVIPIIIGLTVIGGTVAFLVMRKKGLKFKDLHVNERLANTLGEENYNKLHNSIEGIINEENKSKIKHSVSSNFNRGKETLGDLKHNIDDVIVEENRQKLKHSIFDKFSRGKMTIENKINSVDLKKSQNDSHIQKNRTTTTDSSCIPNITSNDKQYEPEIEKKAIENIPLNADFSMSLDVISDQPVNQTTESHNDEQNNFIEKTKKKPKYSFIFGITSSIILIILLSSGLTYAIFSNKISLPFLTTEVNEPEITMTSNTDGSSTVTISNSNTFGTIYYTIDGSEPLTNSKKYDSPITLSSTTTLKARVIDEKDNQSDITTQQFTIVEKIVEKPAETVFPQNTSETIIPEEYQGTWYSIKATSTYNFSGNTYTYSSGGNVHSGTIGKIEPYGNSSTILVFYPVEVNHGFTVDPGEKGDGMIKIDGTTYAVENSDVFD